MSRFYTRFMSDRLGKTPYRLFIPVYLLYLHMSDPYPGFVRESLPRPDELNRQKKLFKRLFCVNCSVSWVTICCWSVTATGSSLPLSLYLSLSIFLSLPSCLDTVVSSRLENKVLIVPTIKLDHATALF